MKLVSIAFALTVASTLASPAMNSSAYGQTSKAAREPRERIIVRPTRITPYWDSYIVPRYRYRPQDDRIDPYGPPVVPVIRYGAQEETVQTWSGASFPRP